MKIRKIFLLGIEVASLHSFNAKIPHLGVFLVSLFILTFKLAAQTRTSIPYQNTTIICACQCNAGSNSSGYLCPVAWTEKVWNAPCDAQGLIPPKCQYLYTCPVGYNVAAPADGNCASLNGMACSGIKHPMAPGKAQSGALECAATPTVVPAPPPPNPTQPTTNPVDTTIPNPWMPKPTSGTNSAPSAPRSPGR